jgi:transposase
MSGKELKRLRTVQDILEKRMTQIEAADELNISTRQVRRLVERYKSKQASGLVHGLRGQKSNRALNPELKKEILEHWRSTYRAAGFNMTHFSEKLREQHKICVGRETIRRYLRDENLYDRKKRRSRKHRSRRERRPRFGELLQQDTSPHDWMGTGVKHQCIVIVDDATSKLVFCKLFENDGTLPNMSALLSVFRTYGLPLAVYTDKAAWFHPNEKKSVVSTFKAIQDEEVKEYQSQIGRALKRLGIEFIAAHSPQAKGRVERSNGTLQDRLIAELKLRGIQTLALANEYIEQSFIADYNRRFGKEPLNPEAGFIKIAEPEILDEIMCIEFESAVQNDNTVSRSRYYRLQLLPTKNRLNWAQAKVIVRITPDQGVIVRHKQSNEKIPFKILELKIPKEFKYKHPDLEDISIG